MSGGYVHCACRDCFEIAIEAEDGEGAFCSECDDAGCDCDAEENEDGSISHDSECRGEHSYGGCEDYESDHEEFGDYSGHIRGDREDFHSDG